MKPTEDKYNAAIAIGWIEELEEENQRLEDELAKYIGGEANEYGQSQQKIAELETELAEERHNQISAIAMYKQNRVLVAENKQLQEQVRVRGERMEQLYNFIDCHDDIEAWREWMESDIDWFDDKGELK